MSWDKNTVNLSQINGYIALLEDLEIPFKVTELGKVKGMGLNDNSEWDEETKNYIPKEYILRKLEVKDLIFIEQMQRTNDCDCDDYIVLLKFKKEEVMDEFPLEITEELKEEC